MERDHVNFMELTLERLEQPALALDPPARARLADKLWASAKGCHHWLAKAQR